MTPARTLDSLLADAARAHADRPALTADDVTLSYRQLDAAVSRLASLVAARGDPTGARVAVIAPNVPALVIGMFAGWRSGAVAVPLSARLREYELKRALTDAEPAVVLAVDRHGGFSFRGLLERLAGELPLGRAVVVGSDGEVAGELSRTAEPCEPSPLEPDIAAILYTSGTTGEAKGALVTHAAALSGAEEVARLIGDDAARTTAIPVPVSHAYGLACLLACVTAGGHAVLVESSTTTGPLLGAIERHDVDVLHGSPALWASLLRARPDGLAPVRSGLSAGSSCPPGLLQDLWRTGAGVLNLWGMSELGPAAACRADDPPAARAHTVGRPLAGYEVRISDDGEIEVRGPNVTPGYHRRPEATAAAFAGEWFRTGDLGSIDADGFLRVEGRAKEVVHVGGFNVFPAEVEGFLLTHPDVVQAVAVGLPHPRLGEHLQAFVVPREGCDLDAVGLRRWARGRIAGYKVPSAVEAVPELPLLPSGKPDRAALRGRLQEADHALR